MRFAPSWTRRGGILLGVLGLVVLGSILFGALALAAPSGRASLIVDVADGSDEARDASGPSGGGSFSYSQDGRGDLRVTASLRGVSPNTTYEVTIWCGRDHTTRTAPGPASQGSPLFHSGEVRTDRRGNADTGAIKIQAATLTNVPDGCPPGLAHINFQNMRESGWYLGTPIEFSVGTTRAQERGRR